MKRCPFCNGKAALTMSGSPYRGYIVVKCKVCGASTRGTYYEDNEISLFDYLKKQGIDIEDTIGGHREIERWEMRAKDGDE